MCPCARINDEAVTNILAATVDIVVVSVGDFAVFIAIEVVVAVVAIDAVVVDTLEFVKGEVCHSDGIGVAAVGGAGNVQKRVCVAPATDAAICHRVIFITDASRSGGSLWSTQPLQ